jgi:hypothetical protein
MCQVNFNRIETRVLTLAGVLSSLAGGAWAWDMIYIVIQAWNRMPHQVLWQLKATMNSKP